MSELLLSWLNDEVQLSQKINSFEKDFSNGYYFGELLSKYNQQLNFGDFENKDLRSAKLNNFTLLQPTFKTLGVKFDTKTVNQIIMGIPNVAEKLLYQLKMALEKVNNPADVLIYSKTGKYNTVTPLKKIKPPKEQYDKMETQFFERRINELNRPQKSINLDNHLSVFDSFKKKQDDKIKKMKDKDELDQKNLKEEVRKIQLNKLQRNMAFLEDWNQKGHENWKKNQDVRKKREESDFTFKQAQEEKTKNRLQLMQELTKKEIVEDIAEFEGNLHKLGITREDEDLDQPNEGSMKRTG